MLRHRRRRRHEDVSAVSSGLELLHGSGAPEEQRERESCEITSLHVIWSLLASVNSGRFCLSSPSTTSDAAHNKKKPQKNCLIKTAPTERGRKRSSASGFSVEDGFQMSRATSRLFHLITTIIIIISVSLNEISSLDLSNRILYILIR